MTPETHAHDGGTSDREAPTATTATSDTASEFAGAATAPAPEPDLADSIMDSATSPTGEARGDSAEEIPDIPGEASSDSPDASPPRPDLGGTDGTDYYAVLGLEPSASAGDIHRAYRRLAKDWHPDRFLLAPPDERAAAERRMRALNQAYATLGDPFLRREYDYDRHPDAALGGTGAPSGWMGGMAPSYSRYGMNYRYDRASARREPSRPAAMLDVGDFFGLLALILALGVFSGSLHAAGDGGGLGPVLGMLVGAAFFLVAMVSFAHGALLVREAENRLGGAGTFDRDLGYDGDDPWAWPTGAQTSMRGAHTATPPERGGDDAEADPEEVAAAARFDVLVDEALASIPTDFLEQMPNVLVEVEREPSAAQLRDAHVPPGYTLLGLYVGVPTLAQGVSGASPEHITIFRGPIERRCDGDPDRIRAQVRATVLHEIAHHFGIDHDEMPDWVK